MPVDYTNLVPATYLIYGILRLVGYEYRCSITDVLIYKFFSGTGIINQAGKIPLYGKIYYCA